MTRIRTILRYLAMKNALVDVVCSGAHPVVVEDVVVSFDHDFVSFEKPDCGPPYLAILAMPIALVTHITIDREATVVFVDYDEAS